MRSILIPGMVFFMGMSSGFACIFSPASDPDIAQERAFRKVISRGDNNQVEELNPIENFVLLTEDENQAPSNKEGQTDANGILLDNLNLKEDNN